MTSIENLFFMLIVSCLCICQVKGIITKSESNKIVEKSDIKKIDNVVAQSINRDYSYDEGYGHTGHGLSAHASYGPSEGYDAYAGIEDIKQHTHHVEDYHHHHHHTDDHHHHHHHGHHKHYDYSKALAIKGLLVPLAGVALLGAAAAFVSNPILLQLGVVSTSAIGRKKRDVEEISMSLEDKARLNEIKVLEKFMAQVPKQEIEVQEKRMLANYLSCSGILGNLCLERLACELHSPEGIQMPTEANVLTIVVNEILANDFIPGETKTRISKAIQAGEKNLGCKAYRCGQLEKPVEFETFKNN